MIQVIAIICGLSNPSACMEKIVTTSDFGNVTMQSCQMGMPQLAEWMRGFPTYRLASWKCQIGERKRAI